MQDAKSITTAHDRPSSPAPTATSAPEVKTGRDRKPGDCRQGPVFGLGARHAALPHLGIDPIIIATQIVAALQTIVSRSINPAECGVISIGQIIGGDTFNVIPESVRMRGTARWFDAVIGNQLESGIRRLTTGIAESFGATAAVDYQRVMPATVNDVVATEIARRAASTVAGDTRVIPMKHPTMGAEDFAFMLEAKSGSYILLGARRDANDPMLHHPRYDFNDDILPIGASYWVTLAEQQLPKSH